MNILRAAYVTFFMRMEHCTLLELYLSADFTGSRSVLRYNLLVFSK